MKFHHESLKRGYVSVKETDGIKMNYNGIKMNYNGRFGKGYIVLKHNPLSTRYCICEYWVA